jgi:cation diffusion facilitator CzcD-associated flavoprotein CzcO
MTTASTAAANTQSSGAQTADVVVVGAGFSGLYALYRLRKLNL